MKNIVLISASPKINEQSTSKYLIDKVSGHIKDTAGNKFLIDVRQSFTKHKTEEDFKTISEADAVVIAFPLYVFCLPGMLMQFLEDYHQFYIKNRKVDGKAKVYAIVNCGFPEPGINLEAVRVIKSFCQQVDMHFRFGILVGAGVMLLGAKDAPFMKKTIRNLDEALTTIARDIESNDLENKDNINISINMPRRFFLFMGNRRWHAIARKNGLNKKDLLKRPYLQQQ